MGHVMPEALFERYRKDPLAHDEEVRQVMKIPEDRYYTVEMWPNAGVVRVTNVNRVVRAKKVSKSDQKP